MNTHIPEVLNPSLNLHAKLTDLSRMLLLPCDTDRFLKYSVHQNMAAAASSFSETYSRLSSTAWHPVQAKWIC